MDQKQTIHARLTGLPATAAGRYQILFIMEGKANGWTFSKQVLTESVPLWENTSVFVDHSFWGQSIRDLGGVLTNAAWSEELKGLTAELTPAGPSAQIVLEAAQYMLRDGPKPDVGFSTDLVFTSDAQRNVEKILRPHSVDLVVDPAFATGFIRQLNQRKEQYMPEQIKEPIKESVAASSADVTAEYAASLANLNLEATLRQAELPESAEKEVRARFAGKQYKPDELTAAVQAWKDAMAAKDAPSQIVGPGRVTQMFSSDDQLQAAMDDLVGAPREKGAEALHVARLSGIREAYLGLTGDRGFVGGYHPDRIQFQATTATFPGLVKNALNKALARHWDQLGRAGYDWWQKIVQVEHFESLNSITWLIFGSVASLPTVSEGAEYSELVIADSPETSSFVKKGGYVGITLEAMDRDDTRKLQQIPRELAWAGLREISALVAAIFTDNSAVGPTLADGGALFNSTAVTTAGGHANLLTTALGTDFTKFDLAAAAMYNQPMLVQDAAGIRGTGKKMAINPKFILVPRALYAQAEALFVPRWQTAIQAVATAGGPSYGGYVEVLTVPEWTDATDWAVVADPLVAPAIMVGERFGLMPQIFLAGSDTDPAMFSNDETRLKVRHFIAVGVADFRPLHKENV